MSLVAAMAAIAVGATTAVAATGSHPLRHTASKHTAGASAVTDGTTSASGGYANAVLGESSLVGYWRLGEGSGLVAADSKGSANGTYRGGVTLGRPGALAGDPDTAVGFDGSTGYVSLPSVGSASDFTIEGWTNLNSGASSSLNGNNTLYGGGGTVRLIVRPNGFYAGVWVGGTEYRIQAGTNANVGSWVYWAMVRSGATLTVYRNGNVVGSVSNLQSGTASLGGAIGSQGGNAYFLNGTIDEVAIYNSALPATTIQNHDQLGVTGSAATGGAASPVLTAEPIATGTVATGQTVSTTNGSWSNSPTSYSYQWQRCPTDGTSCSNITGANSQTYTVQAADSGDVLRAQVTATNGAGSSSPTASPMIPFGDTFDSSSVDPNIWAIYNRHGDSTQSEPECYVASNLTEGNSVMTELVEKRTINPCPYGQGQATTSTSYASAETQASTFNFEYGTLRARIEFAGGTSWPALWMLGSSYCQYPNNLDTCTNCNRGSEVDLAEINHNVQTESDFYDNAMASCNFPGCTPTVPNVSTSYHTYEFDWTSTQMVMKFDGSTICTVGTGGLSEAIPNLPMFPIIDTALHPAAITDSTLPQTTKVDWIYVTTNSPSATTTPTLTDNTSSGRFQHGDQIQVSNNVWGSGMSCGVGGVTCTYQWKHCDPSVSGSGYCTVINGATSSTYTLATGDEGDYITASVTASTASGASSASTPLSIAVS